ncbi:MAG: ComF family protein [Clostridiaceae bacterium]|nr:ComF family protein [Clostridiaceae bacterium]
MNTLELKKPGFAERLIRLLYPVKCMCCGVILREDTVLSLCEACYKMLPRCECGFYETFRLPYIDGLFSAFHYEQGIDKAIQEMKFKNQPGLAKTLAYILGEEYMKEPVFPPVDLIIPVPMHRSKKRQRGFNQAELLAERISGYLNIPLDKTSLVKVRNTKPQSSLARMQRLNNLENAFEIKNIWNIKDKNILLVDDVITTGTTIDTCGKILYESGAAKIYAMVLAIAGN